LGGPQQQQDSTVEFLMGNTKIASANSVGLITAATLGSTKLVGRVFGVDKGSILQNSHFGLKLFSDIFSSSNFGQS
jgi:hypothetical protein